LDLDAVKGGGWRPALSPLRRGLPIRPARVRRSARWCPNGWPAVPCRAR